MPILITGPARSGKSEWAEVLAAKLPQQTVYIATARIDPADIEWQNRIDLHRQRRPSHWVTLEIPTELTKAIQDAKPEDCLLIDSLGTWVANLLAEPDSIWEMVVKDLCVSLQQTPAIVILVGEETGWGIIPAYPSGRTFRDRLGRLLRQISAISDPVYLVVAGRAIDLNQIGTSIE